MLCGRTLFGAKPPKGQELDDHYYGAIKPRVASFMHELDQELWQVGVLAKTEHNEVAPAQHEIAPVYSDANSACDHNQLTMEFLKKVADRHDLVCLLHEKPFAGVNGSGKHDNWSLATDTGENLLKPGRTPSQNAQFLLFLAAFIKGVDEYQEMLRCCVSYPGNDHRLGGNEAPPAIVSIFLGDELTAILRSIIDGTAYVDITKKKLEIGVDTLPELPQDTTDRNRTSPLAFTGNKVEFRMLGSSQSIASPNVVLNTIMADELKQFADRLEKAESFHQALQELLRDTFRDHQRIIFDGNGYDDDWVQEAKRRGLSNLRDTVDCMPAYIDEKNVALFSRFGILTPEEMHARYEIHLENYCKVTAIEAATLRDDPAGHPARRHPLHRRSGQGRCEEAAGGDGHSLPGGELSGGAAGRPQRRPAGRLPGYEPGAGGRSRRRCRHRRRPVLPGSGGLQAGGDAEHHRPHGAAGGGRLLALSHLCRHPVLRVMIPDTKRECVPNGTHSLFRQPAG